MQTILQANAGRIEEVQPQFVKVRLMDKPAPKKVRVKALVITK
jgi:hypothetical protein